MAPFIFSVCFLYVIEHRAVSLIVILVYVVLGCILHPMITSFVILRLPISGPHTAPISCSAGLSAKARTCAEA